MKHKSAVAAAVVGVVLVVVVLALVVKFGPGTLYAADTDTVGVNGCGIGGENAIGGGQFPDVPTDSRKVGELASVSVLYYSWFQDGESYPLTVQGNIQQRTCNGNIGHPEGAYYRFSYSTDGRKWVAFTNDRNPSGSVKVDTPGGGIAGKSWTAPAYVYTIDGYEFFPCTYPADTDSSAYYVSKNVLTCTGDDANPVGIEDGAALRVEMFTYQRTQFEGEGFWRLFATDEVVLRSAIPEVRFEKAAYKVGETARVTWEVPATTNADGKCAYFLSVLNLNTNAPVGGYDRKCLTSTTGVATISVDASFFTNAEGCQNRLRAIIYSTLIRADLDETAIQSETKLDVGAAPKVTSVTFDHAEYFEGDVATVTISYEGTVTKVHLTAHIGGLVVYDKDVNLTANSTAKSVTISFSLPITGVLETKSTAYNNCQPSEVYTAVASVGNVLPDYCVLFPNHPACTTGTPTDWVKTALAILGVLGVLVGAALVARLVPVKGRNAGLLQLGVFFAVLVPGVVVVLALLGFLGGA